MRSFVKWTTRQSLACLLVPSFAFAQAAGISRPMVVPDSEWIGRQCEEFEQLELTNDAAQLALERANEACASYMASAGGQVARDAWVRDMLAIQDDVGAAAMRRFVPEFGEELPSDLDSYSLFLIPDESWRGERLALERTALWNAFFSFGQAIGDTHAAIWFLDAEDNVDVMRSKDYCDNFGLSYNDGPYVVVTRKRPDLVTSDDEIVVIRMGGIDPDGILAILNRLAQDLRTDRDVNVAGLLYEEIKQRLQTLIASYPESARAFVSLVLGR